MLSSAKQKKLTSTAFGGDGHKKVFFNDHLTPLGSAIFREAKKLKFAGFKYIWIKNGNIYCKLNDNVKAVELKSVLQVTNLLKGRKGDSMLVDMGAGDVEA